MHLHYWQVGVQIAYYTAYMPIRDIHSEARHHSMAPLQTTQPQKNNKRKLNYVESNFFIELLKLSKSSGAIQ